MSVLATLQVTDPAPGACVSVPESGINGSPVAVILIIWIYASIYEEIFTRGLLLSWLSPPARHRIRAGRSVLSIPVLTSALAFSAMHVVLWPMLGPATLIVMFPACILGLIAGHYRHKTASLIPAILIHAFFDIGGTLPSWISPWLHQGHI